MVRRLAFVLLALTVLSAPMALADEWIGWITDEHCGAKGASAEHKSCALSCAGRGAAFVLYTDADKQLYKLSDQKAAKEHVGSRVKVVGTKDESGIKVESITPVEAE
jgi:hypothetical protein